MSTDRDLLRRSSRDPAAFASVYDRHAPAVMSFVAREVNCPHTAEDIVAETFAQAYVSRRSFRGDDSAKAWLIGIARRQLWRYYRHKDVDARARRRLGMHIREHGSAEPDDAIDHSDASSVPGLLSSLPPETERAVRLRVVDQLSYGEIAAQLGCTPGAARVRVHRGLKTLRSRYLQTHDLYGAHT